MAGVEADPELDQSADAAKENLAPTMGRLHKLACRQAGKQFKPLASRGKLPRKTETDHETGNTQWTEDTPYDFRSI